MNVSPPVCRSPRPDARAICEELPNGSAKHGRRRLVGAGFAV
ncbi:hypothetical protein OHS71_03595 [Streptomyces sp. NBC_00377]|nr:MULTISPECIES: hypothetical protein [unclassified Streptomyces]